LFWKAPRIPIFHIASLARSGETLLLRCLNQHTRLQVVHNLSSQDAHHEWQLFEFLRDYEPTSISLHHELVKPYRLTRRHCLVLKQGVWRHRYPFRGIALVRQAMACFASLKNYDGRANGKSPEENWHLNYSRLTRWLGDMDAAALNGFDSLTPVQQFARFYETRISQLFAADIPLLRYEDLVSAPWQILTGICKHFGVSFEPALLQSHLSHQGQLGHGQNALDKPISQDSLYKYTQAMSRAEFDELANLLEPTLKSLGYSLYWGASGVAEIDTQLGKVA
jgi:hypothetical protein